MRTPSPSGPAQGYLRQPSLGGGRLAFVCEDDIWLAPADGGRASRLTAGSGESTHPCLSPDGRDLAWTDTEEGPPEVWYRPVEGGPARRLTFQAATRCTVLGWHPVSGEILYASTAEQYPGFGQRLFAVDPAGGPPRLLPWGPATTVAYGPGGVLALGRNTTDPARWKRYRGGTAGELWIGSDEPGAVFRPLETGLAGALAFPAWAGERVCFISDHDGWGNVWSCLPDGTGLVRHTDHSHFYARALAGDGSTMVYQCGGRLHTLDPSDGVSRPLEVTLHTSRSQHVRRFADASDFLEDARPDPGGSRLAVTARGRLFTLEPWEGPVRAHGEQDGARHRLPDWLAGGRLLAALTSDERPTERLVVLDTEAATDPRELPLPDLGRGIELVASPAGPTIALATSRHELHLITVPETDGPPQHRTVDHSPYGPVQDLAWSSDGRWLAYSWPSGPHTAVIKVADAHNGQTRTVTEPVLRDSAPCFGPEGRYLYFIGQRELTPVPEGISLGFGFPRAGHPYVITLRPDLTVPWLPVPQYGTGSTDESATATTATEGATAPVEIHFDGIEERVAAVPVAGGDHRRVLATRHGLLLLSVPPVLPNGSAGSDDEEADEDEAVGVVDHFTHPTRASTRYVEGVEDIRLDASRQRLLCEAGTRLRVLPAAPQEDEPPKSPSGPPGRESGWAALERVRVPVQPHAEWGQMLREAWRLQKEHFWDPRMAGVDWEEVYGRYRPLLDLVGSRGELSDLMWEMQGELGTSHAYELGGQYRRGHQYAQGFLGVDWRAGPDSGHGALVERVPSGEPWNPRASSPCAAPGTGVRPGDRVTAVDGLPVGPAGPGELLVCRARHDVELTVRGTDGHSRRTVVRTLADEAPLRYRSWVRANREQVRESTAGRVGYLHVPDMFETGYAEFMRAFLAFHDREALVVDVRFNGGGFVSPLLLERLARYRRGFEFGRWNGALPYPAEAPRGPMVALVNEHTGSDGDIFAHMFQRMGLGPVVGCRTWGGVIAAEPRFPLVDGTITTQPEYMYDFDDVGRSLENRGVVPDIDVRIAPHEHALGLDTQLVSAVEAALEQLSARPARIPAPSRRTTGD